MSTETISSTEANRKFAAILRGVSEGTTYLVTNHGRVVARIEPVNDEEEKRATARQSLIDRWTTQPGTAIRPWSRDELYDDDL